MSVQAKTSYFDMAAAIAQRGLSCWTASCEPGQLQNKVQALTRTVVGIASTALFKEAALAGALLGVIKPEYTHEICQKVDGLVTGLWNSLSHKQKMAASVAGISLAYVGIGYLYIPGSFLAAKLAAELAYKNSIKQELAVQIQQLEEKFKAE